MLVEASERKVQHPPAVLAISQPDTPHHRLLPGTVTEVRAIEDVITAAQQQFKWLNRTDATIEAVLEEMQTHAWCHFACHAIQNDRDPTRSAFALHNGSLELSVIMSKMFKSAELAFLSACQTAKGDESLPEESVHLAAGMLVAGYRTVVATMWSIGDQEAPLVAEEFYSFMLNSRKEKSDGENQAAYALHHALNRLRKEAGERSFAKWVPFVHFGV